MTDTLITSEGHFDSTGKPPGQFGVPHSVHRSAYGWGRVLITVIRNGARRPLIISAGAHGDEYEGQIAIANLARDLDTAEITGRLILLPMMNYPAADVGCRDSRINDDTDRSLAQDERLANPNGHRMIWEAIITLVHAEMTFAINRDLLVAGVTTTDDEMCDAMRCTAETSSWS